MRLESGLVLLAFAALGCEVVPPRAALTPWATEMPSATTRNLNEAGRFVVGLAPLEGDVQGPLTAEIVSSLARLNSEIEVRKAGAPTPPLDASALELEQPVQQLRPALVESGVDVLIWGYPRAVSGGSVTQLLVAAAPRDWQSPLGANESSGRPLRVERYTLPAEPWTSVAGLLQMIVLTEATSFDPVRYPAASVTPLLQEVEKLVTSPAFAGGGNAGWSAESRWQARSAYAGALQSLGRGERRSDSLYKSIEVWRQALAEAPRTVVPLRWAETQNNLALALQTLEHRSTINSKRLEEAVALFRAALQERTRERFPLDWASTQHNLGNALRDWATRESSIPLLEEAVAAFRAALQERTRERVPLDWATTQNDLGAALGNLAERQSDAACLVEAEAAFRAALEECTRERTPTQWALTQSNLARLLVRSGKQQEGTAQLEEAVAICRSVLEVRTRERSEYSWASSQDELGVALTALGEKAEGTAHLEQAALVFRAALEERTRRRNPFAWATTQSNLGLAQRTLAARQARPACEAIVSHWNALEVFRPSAIATSKVSAQLQLDFKSSPVPTPALCPLVPREAWALRQ